MFLVHSKLPSSKLLIADTIYFTFGDSLTQQVQPHYLSGRLQELLTPCHEHIPSSARLQE